VFEVWATSANSARSARKVEEWLFRKVGNSAKPVNVATVIEIRPNHSAHLAIFSEVFSMLFIFIIYTIVANNINYVNIMAIVSLPFRRGCRAFLDPLVIA
jgi:hypothetical protein